MNSDWQKYLLSPQAMATPTTASHFSEPLNSQYLYPLTHLGVLTVGGKDAATLLQGQITCNIKDITDTQSSLGAICNPKGRAIALFLIIKQNDDFHLILPIELLATVKKRLTLFVLRSVVTLTDTTDNHCLLGITNNTSEPWLATQQDSMIQVNLGNRLLILAEANDAIAFWSEHRQQRFQSANTESWQLLDMTAGIPWLGVSTSEAFVPQMLNLDKLGGISFTKGCYTGQEIIARMHYLGKSKRGMVFATSVGSAPEVNASVFNENNETAGQVLSAQTDGFNCQLLLVIQLAENNVYQLKLADGRTLTVLPFF